MRVTFVSPFDPLPMPGEDASGAHVGGVERVLERLAREVAARGHDVTVLCSHNGTARTDWDDALRVVRVPRSATLLRAPVANLHRHIPREADLVHVPATYPFTTPGVLHAAHRRGVPSVLDFHFEPDPGTAFGRAAARAYRAVGPRSYRLARAVIVRSSSYARSAPSLQGVAPERLRILPNGVDTARFRPAAPQRRGDYLLVVGRLVPYKGIEVLLRALAMMRHPPPLRIAGDGPLRAALQDLAARLRVDATFLGRVPDEDLPDLYRGARLTILPSVNRQEAFGIALLESMACGTPVVASRLPGVSEVAALGGPLAEPGNANALGAAVQAALDSPTLLRGEALATQVREHYAWPVLGERLLALYRGILDPPEVRAGQPIGPEVFSRARPRGHSVL